MATNNIRGAAPQSRTPILNTYQIVYKFIPEKPEIARIISRRRKIICINLAARPGANVDQLEA